MPETNAQESDDKIVKRKLSDAVFDRLVEMIQGDGFAPGAQLPSERALMDRFGVGRPAVREAMQALEAKGLITISHGERARVATPTALDVLAQIDLPARSLLSSSPQNLEDLKEARLFFEVGMVRMAARIATPDHIAGLRDMADRQKQAYGNDHVAFVAADMAFHTAIATITGNAIFEATSKAMLGWFAAFHAGILHWEGGESYTLEEHDAMIEQIAAHDADGAAARMEDHLKRTRAYYTAATPARITKP